MGNLWEKSRDIVGIQNINGFSEILIHLTPFHPSILHEVVGKFNSSNWPATNFLLIAPSLPKHYVYIYM